MSDKRLRRVKLRPRTRLFLAECKERHLRRDGWPIPPELSGLIDRLRVEAYPA